MDLWQKLLNLPFAPRQRLITGLLDGPIVIKLPEELSEEDIATISREIYLRTICRNAKLSFHYNGPMLQDILGLDKYLANSSPF
jgi:hypothetical protein